MRHDLLLLLVSVEQEPEEWRNALLSRDFRPGSPYSNPNSNPKLLLYRRHSPHWVQEPLQLIPLTRDSRIGPHPD